QTSPVHYSQSLHDALPSSGARDRGGRAHPRRRAGDPHLLPNLRAVRRRRQRPRRRGPVHHRLSSHLLRWPARPSLSVTTLSRVRPMPIRDLTSVLFLTALIGGCAERLEPEGAPLEELPSDPSGPETGSFPSRSGKFAHVVGSDGVITTVVDASDGSSWQTLDLDSGHASDDDWDLGFSRFRVKSNGGVSGGGGVQVAPLDGVECASVDEPPASGWLFDREAEASDDAPAFVSALRNAFHREDAEWYEYDGATHMLTPKDITFVVAS